MTFDEVLSQVQELLQREKRVSYRGLKRRFALDDEYLEDLKEELIGAKRLAVDEEGRFLVWTGDQEPTAASSGFSSLQSPAAPAESPPPEAERRQLTVMFCDLVDSTALSGQLDPEELREVVRLYQETCTAVIQRYAGHIAQHLGDGLLVYFSYPMAHEDDAQRAVRAGIEIIDALRESPLQNRPLPHSIQVRIGIHTGLVVIGEIGSSAKREILALGETPNIAARVQGIAEPDTVVMSTVTHRLVQGLFECQDLGPQTLKGIATPLSLYRVIGESAAQSRFEVAVGIGLTPLIGREEELSLLQRRWLQAKEGTGQVVLLSGEAGIGKSRLVQTLKEQVLAEGATRIEFRCSPYHSNSALYPIIEHLQRLLQLAHNETPEAKLAKLRQALVAYRFPQANTLPLLAALLSLPQPEGLPPLTLSPQKQKQKTQEALVAWIVEEAEKAAVYCAWEDLHWIDPSTLEVLTLFLEQIPTTRMFAMLTFRPDFIPSWSPGSYFTPLTLNRLGRLHVEAMVEEVAGGKALPVEVLQQIVSKTDGVPLFVEELTKMVLESGLVREEEDRYVGAHSDAPIPPLAIPSTLQDSLMARLDRLAPVREIAQVGAVLGREFSYDLLHAVSRVEESALQQGLRQLVDAELLYQRGLPPQATYLFKHALIQDTAYQSLLKSKRQQYHQQIARVLEEGFPDTKATQPELVAHHYTEAGLIHQAISYWQRAGQRANKRSAYVEAISHLRRGIGLLMTLPDTSERTRAELGLQLILGAALMATQGYAAPAVEEPYGRARALCQRFGETPQLFPVLIGLHAFYTVRGDLQQGHTYAEQCLRLARHGQDPALLLAAHAYIGHSLYYLGEFSAARDHIKEAVALYGPPRHHAHTLLYETDPGVAAGSAESWTLHALGYFDQAVRRSREAVALARKLSHAHSLAYALVFAAYLHGQRREEHAAQEQAEAAVALAAEQGLVLWLALGTFYRGWALAQQGLYGEGIALMRHGQTSYQATGARLGSTANLFILAEACGQAGQVEEGLQVIDEAFAAVSRNGELAWEAELWRGKGNLLLRRGEREIGRMGDEGKVATSPNRPFFPSSPEECFLKAIDIAQKQHAKAWELRATTSLARVWQHQGKTPEAHRMLSEVYHWFTEGFDTKDLQEAKALLEELT